MVDRYIQLGPIPGNPTDKIPAVDDQGNLTIRGGLTVSGTVNATGSISTAGSISVTGAGSFPSIAYIAGKNYTMHEQGRVTTAAIGAVDVVYLTPFRVYSTLAFTSGSVKVSAGGAGSSVKAGIWANSAVSGRPLGAPLYSDNTSPATTGTGLISLTMAGTLTTGIYWFGCKFTGTLPTMTAFDGPMTIAPNGGNICNGIQAADAYANNIAALTFAEGFGSFSISLSSLPYLVLNT